MKLLYLGVIVGTVVCIALMADILHTTFLKDPHDALENRRG